jgi:hypothetical protein
MFFSIETGLLPEGRCSEDDVRTEDLGLQPRSTAHMGTAPDGTLLIVSSTETVCIVGLFHVSIVARYHASFAAFPSSNSLEENQVQFHRIWLR